MKKRIMTFNIRIILLLITSMLCVVGCSSKKSPGTYFFPIINKKELANIIKLPIETRVTEILDTSNIISTCKNIFTRNESFNLKVLQDEIFQNIVAIPVYNEKYIIVLKNTGYVHCYMRESKQLKWTYKILSSTHKDSVKQKYYSLSIHKELLTVTAKNILSVLNIHNKEEVMYKIFDSPIISSAVISKDNIMYVQTVDGMHQFDMLIKRKIHTLHTYLPDVVIQDQVFTPILYKDGVLVTNTENQILYLKKNNIIFSIPLSSISSLSKQSPSLVKNYVSFQPILKGNELFVVIAKEKIVKINLENKKIVWEKNIPGVAKIFVIGDTTFAIGYSNQVVALQNKTGDIIWASEKFDYKNASAYLAPFIVNSKLCIVSTTNNQAILISMSDGSSEAKLNIQKISYPYQMLGAFPIDDALWIITTKNSVQIM